MSPPYPTLRTLNRSMAHGITRAQLSHYRFGTAKQRATVLRSYVDGGGHPDTFTANVFRAALTNNQAAKGKVQAVGCATIAVN